MPGMMGASSPGAAAARYDPSQLTGQDKMMLLGAMLRDTGNSLRGGDSDAVLATRNFLAQRQMYQNSMGMLRGLMGGQAQYQDGPDPSVSAPSLAAAANPGAPPAPTSMDDLTGGLAQAASSMTPAATSLSAGPSQPYVYQPPTQVPGTGPISSIADPRLRQLALAGPMMGIDPKNLIEVLKANQPQYDTARPGATVINKLTGQTGATIAAPQYINGQLVDPTKPGAPGFVPQSPVPGANPVYDSHGAIVDWGLPGGAARAIGASEAAKTGAEEAAKLPYVGPAAFATARGGARGNLQTIPLPGGGTTLMGGDEYLDGRAAAPGGPSGPVAPGAGPIPQVGAPAPAAAGPGAGLGVSQSPADAEYQKNLAATAAAHFKALQDAGAAAPSSIARLQAMRGLLQGWEGGKYSPQMVDIASAMNSLGLQKMDPKTQNAQAAQALQAQMTMELMKNPDTGANMFPRVTNFEMQQFTKAVPGLMQSPGSREKLIDMYSAIQQRAADVAGMARQWNQQYGRIDAPDRAGRAFQDRLDAWSQQHPLFGGIPGAQGILKGSHQ